MARTFALAVVGVGLSCVFHREHPNRILFLSQLLSAFVSPLMPHQILLGFYKASSSVEIF